MEKKFKQIFDQSFTESGAIGSVLVDENGLCIASKGNASQKSSGNILSLITKAAEMHPESKTPTVTIDYGDKVCSIAQHERLTAALYKKSKTKH